MMTTLTCGTTKTNESRSDVRGAEATEGRDLVHRTRVKRGEDLRGKFISSAGTDRELDKNGVFTFSVGGKIFFLAASSAIKNLGAFV